MASLTSTAAFDAAELLVDATWLRALVRRLIADEATVDDVVQETWLAALRRSPAIDRHGPLRSWLATVARNLALRARRRSSTRGHVERAAARPEAVASALDDLERLQLHKLLVGAVIDLPEPQRSAVTARYFDELSYEDIARRQRCSAVAARQRVSRGLASLRSALDREFRGDRAHWCVAFTAAFGLSRAARAGWVSFFGGGVAMGVKGALAGVAAAAGIALTAALWVQRPGESAASSPPAASGSVAPASELAQTSVPLASDLEVPDERRAATNASTPAASARLRGRVTDTSGRALAGAQVRLFERPIEDGATPRIAGESDEHGAFALALPDGEARSRFELEVAHDGYVPRRTTELDGELAFELQRLPQLRGRLLAPLGKRLGPPWKLQVAVRPPDGRAEETRNAEIAPDGSYSIADLPPGTLVRCDARVRNFARTERAQELALEPDGVHALDIELEVGSVIEGVVLDAVTRGPIAGARVWTDEWFLFDPDPPGPFAVSDALGRFRVEGATLFHARAGQMIAAHVWYSAEAKGYAPPGVRVLTCNPDEHGTSHVEILLDPSTCRLAGLVLMPDGVDPAGGASVLAIDGAGKLRSAQTEDDGTFAIEDLAAGALVVAIRRDVAGRRMGTRATLELVPARGGVDRFVLREGDASIAGRVVDTAGTPLAGARVDLATRIDGKNMSLAMGYADTATDAEGRYRFAGLVAGTYMLSVSDDPKRTPCSRPKPVELELDTGANRDAVDFRAGPCASVRGRVELGGRSTEGLEVTLRRRSDDEPVARAGVEPDGAYELDAVLADVFDVVLTADGQEVDRARVGERDEADVLRWR